MEKKEIFKLIIDEFQKKNLPEFKQRDFDVPDINKVISITGSRRSGKTYFFYQKISYLLKNTAKENILYINFSDERLFPLKLPELQYILDAYFELYPKKKEERIYLFLDEVQEVEEWEKFVRRIHDTENIRIFITGSSSKLLNKEIHTSLRGRTLNYTMYPLSFMEFLRFENVVLEKNFEYSSQRYLIKKYLSDYLRNGGFPETVIFKDQQMEILKNYTELIIYKDLVERYNIRNLSLVKHMLKYLLTNISAPFSVHSYRNVLSQEMAVKEETISEYLSYMEDAYIVFPVSIFSYSIKKQQANPKKIYCIDNGLRNVVSFQFSKDEGRLAENLVFISLIRNGKEVYYWKDKQEVDFIVKDSKADIIAINVFYSDDISERETASLLDFKKEFNKTKELIILTKDLEKKENGIKFIPLWKWLLTNNNL